MLHFKSKFFLLLIAIFGALGVYIGYITVDRFQFLVNASLGLTVLYLLHKQFLSSTEPARFPIKERFELPKDIRYLVYAFTLAVIMFWACIQVLHLFGFG